jgi:predicted PurR-regulated permease PerM
MKTIQKIILFFLLAMPIIGNAETKEIPFTLDDRDRIIRTEQKVESVKIEMNARFETVNKQLEGFRSENNTRFEQLFSFLWAIIGIFTTMMVSIFGFAFWDRKLSLAPLKKEDQRILAVLVDFAKTQPKLSEILKNAGLL